MGVLQLSAEARERGFGKQRGDDECDHLPALFIIVAAALQESHEMVEGSGLAGADGQAVGIGIVQPHHVEIPHVGDRDGEFAWPEWVLHAEDQPA